MSLSVALDTLANYRANNIRASQETFDKGSQILKSNAVSKLGENSWAFLEQLTLAAIDIGRLDVADVCLEQLSRKFPRSPRVDVLQGIRIEASQSAHVALQYYNQLLSADPSNAAFWKRRISVLRRSGSLEEAVAELSKYLDTFYNDLEAWLELADIYSSCNLYTSALKSLSHALLISPQNPFTVLQFAETAYTAGDLPLALKMFLVVIDMDDESAAKELPRGVSVRAWFGIKLCSRRLVQFPTLGASKTPVPKNVKAIEELATEQVLLAYGKKGLGGTLNRDMNIILGRFSAIRQVGYRSMSNVLTRFLTDSKQKYLNDIHATPARGSEWLVVMGNEAGDLDTFASSIAYAYFCSTHGKTPTVPLVQINRADLSLRAENLYALSLAGITDPGSQILFLSDIPLDSSSPFPSNNFALLDHNRLGSRYSAPSAVVTAIIDHHADENQHLTANPRIVAPAGSCSSHVTHLLINSTSEGGDRFDIPSELATLLLSAILIDTHGLKSKRKALAVDYAAAYHLLPRSSLAPSVEGLLPTSISDDNPPAQMEQEIYTIPSIQELAATLDSKKFDLSHLSAYDNLRRDYKEYTYQTPSITSQSNGKVEINVGLSTVPLPLEADWTANGQLLKSSMEWMTSQNLIILGVLTSFHAESKKKKKKTGKGKQKREMAWFIRSTSSLVDMDALSKRLFSGLEADKELELKIHNKFRIEVGDRDDLRVLVYKQKNADITRKGIAPLVQKILEA